MKQLYILLFVLLVNSCTKNEYSAESNLPGDEDFQKEIQSELNRYFSEEPNKTLKINWHLLNNKPLEKENSYPEYFVWVKIYEDKRLVNQGLTKLLVKDKKFHSISFMNDERLRQVPYDAEREFTPEILEKIKDKISNSAKSK
ncbi:hypothetical protein [uncultured Chryseobacterium sp.]|uniref:hypothetical protein n=1 Tax=uncultured Chryseobacterium sp. TaxID=259322 RepID=UPI0025D73B86|nr:hypothetical protein [uncultured Chryseobacterium sp.]